MIDYAWLVLIVSEPFNIVVNEMLQTQISHENLISILRHFCDLDVS